jgi:peptidoglycan/xylan/chitin deacetylase (PgdA/CDA1 family)
MSVPDQVRRPLAAWWGILTRQSRPVAEAAADRWRVLVMAGLLGLALVLTAALSPISVNLGGRQQIVSRNLTAGAAAERLGYPLQGHLVSVTGEILREGGGQPARLWRNGEPCGPEVRLRRGDRLAVLPGGDVSEPCRETVTVLKSPPSAALSLAEPAVQGTRRVRRGLTSGAVAVQVAWAVPTVPLRAATASRGPRLALTFDDGPWPDTTAALLKILRQHDSRATFFVLASQAAGRPDIIKATVAQGSEIGIHSWRHANYTRLSAAAVQADLSRCEAVLRPLVGQPVRWVRPPYGATNRTVNQVISQAGYRLAMWTIDTSDWRRPGANAIASHLLSRAHDGAVVLCHDGGGDRRGTVAAMARAVPELRRRGYQLVTLSELKGLRPLPAGGAIVTAAGHRYEIKQSVAGLQVQIDGVALELPEPPVEVNSQLMLPVKPTLERLGVTYRWDQATQALTVESVEGQVILRVNEASLESEGGLRQPLDLPLLLYHNRAVLPLPMILRLTGATAEYDTAGKTLNLITPFATLRTGQLAPLHIPKWLPDEHWSVTLAHRL